MGKVTGQVIPAARRDGLVVKQLNDEILVYDTERGKAHCLNQTAALVWKYCDGQTDVDEIVAKLRAESSTSINETTVSLAVAQLAKTNLLSDNLDLNTNRFSRRELIRALGIGALVAVPVITSIVAPTAAHASTCVTFGGPCLSSSECCDGLCSGGNTCA